jgi:magnesium chelatase family protein
MALSQVYSRACVGVESPLITVEVHLSGGLPSMSIVGLPETAVKEAKDRVRAALLNAGYDFPVSRITISLAPAELPKEGGGFDLPIALGILAASGQVPDQLFAECEFLGELSLSGDLRAVRGVLPAAVRAAGKGRTLIIPSGNEAEAALVNRGSRLCAASLLQVAAFLGGRLDLPPACPGELTREDKVPDLADVIGQERARRAIEVAAAGAHNLLMSGPPGTGKTMLASRLPGILPELTEEEALETASVASISRQGLDIGNWKKRPFRAPHHTCSGIALVGGGSNPRPGEISLAHNGVLFLDELPEFSRHVLEVLREPMESGRIIISRAARQAEFPARFQLVAAMNPCPCGHAGDAGGQCRCSADQVQRYRSRISGPLLDRIDIQVDVIRPEVSILDHEKHAGEPSSAVMRRVTRARDRQLRRAGLPNAHLDSSGLRAFCHLGRQEKAMLETAVQHLRFSPRACHRALKVARTIADLEGADDIGQPHLAEAIAYRCRDGAMPVC